MKPLCYDCLSEDVTVKVILPNGVERYLCAEDWAAHQALGEKLASMLERAAADREAP